MLDALRGEELFLDELQVGLVSHTMQSRWIDLLLFVEGRAVAIAAATTFGFRTVASVPGWAATEVTQTVVISVWLTSGLGHL